MVTDLHQAARMQLRAAVHCGLLKRTAHGMYGDPLIELARLLDAGPLREALGKSGMELAVAYSDRLYRDVVLGAPSRTSPADFTLFECTVKNDPVRGWLFIPGTVS